MIWCRYREMFGENRFSLFSSCRGELSVVRCKQGTQGALTTATVYTEANVCRDGTIWSCIIQKTKNSSSSWLWDFTTVWVIMQKDAKIYVAGHRGMVWSAIVRRLALLWYSKIIIKSRAELDLTQQDAVNIFFKEHQPDYVFLAAAKVWWILANRDYPADFIYQNLQIQNNIIHYAWKYGVTKLLFLWSSCIYPKVCPQPIKEEYLLTGQLESTNEPYAIAKIAGMKMCQSYNRQYWTQFIACMPTNLYGCGDNFDLATSHVLPAMIRKFHEAKINKLKTVTLWGDGAPRREFLYVDDMADGCIHLMQNFTPTQDQSEQGRIFFNIGVGKDIPIKELANTIKNIVGFTGEIIWDSTKPNGTMRKVLDVSMMRSLGRTASTQLKYGIKKTYKWFLET